MPEAQTPDADTLSKATEQLIEELPANAEPAPQPAAQEPAKVPDPDEQELVDARAALAAEEAAKAGGTKPPDDKPPAAEAPTAPAAPAAGTEPAPATDDKSTVMIPKARLDEVLRQRDEAATRAAYLSGVLEANKEMRQTTTAPAQTDTTKPAQPPAKTLPEVLAEIDQGIIALAKKYDEGELTASEWRGQELILMNQRDTINREASKIDAEGIKNQAVETARLEAMNERLQTHADNLDTQHPSLLEVKADYQWAFLREEAAKLLADQGVVLKEGDARSLMVFRETMAGLADKYVPIWTGKTAPAAPASSGSPANPPVSKQPSIAEQRRAKLNLAHQQPPDSSTLGASGTKTELTDGQIATMSDDEIANLPASTRARVTGRAA